MTRTETNEKRKILIRKITESLAGAKVLQDEYREIECLMDSIHKPINALIEEIRPKLEGEAGDFQVTGKYIVPLTPPITIDKNSTKSEISDVLEKGTTTLNKLVETSTSILNNLEGRIQHIQKLRTKLEALQ